MNNKYVFFWGGPFSQWAEAYMEIDGKRFNCCEQWMMYNKAMMFNDLVSAELIMATKSPHKQKELGRKVQNFNDAVWMEKAYDIVVVGNRAKFLQNEPARQYLETTIGKEIVEASPYDRRWGIGMAEGDQGIDDPANWKGENLLGKAIMQVRQELFGE